MRRLGLLAFALGVTWTAACPAQGAPPVSPPAAPPSAVPAAEFPADRLPPPASAEAVEAAPAVGEAPPAYINLTDRETKTYRGVLVHMEYWVPLPEQWDLTRPATLEVHFSHSPVLIERLSSMTASINGNAINSVFLSVDNAKDAHVSWDVPAEYIKLGESNQIELTAKMRSDLELCDDVHSPALWLTIEKDTQLVVRYREKPVVPNLAKFPASYLRPDIFYSKEKSSTQKTHALVVVPTSPSAEVLTGVGVVSARLGADTRFDGGAVRVMQVGDITADVQSELAKNNLIFIGPSDFINRFGDAGLDLVPEFASGDAGRGHLFESPNPFNAGRRALVVTGADDAALAKVITTLSLPRLSKEWETKPEQTPIRWRPFDTKPEIPAAALDEKLGQVTISLADLGASDLTERGKFNHFVRVAFPNPYVGRIKAPTFIRLAMSYSELLVSQTSSLLVKINGEPVRSIRLSPRTAKNLEADIVIPEKFFGARTLVADLEFFLDIGDPDCRYNFPEMAWVSLFNRSFVAYTITDVPTTSLRSYPWVAGKEPNLNGLLFAVADQPSDEALSVVANIAAYLGTKVPRRIGADGKSLADWVHPWTKRIGSLTDAELADRDLVVVGDYATVKANTQVLASVPESMFADTVSSDNLRTYSGDAFRAEAGWVLLAKSPWNARRNLMVVSGGRGEPAFREAGEYLWVQKKVDNLAGSAVLVGPNGSLEVVMPAPGEEVKAQMGPMEPQLPVYEDARATAAAAPGAEGAGASQAVIAEVPSAATSGGSQTNVAYMVFIFLGILLVVLVVARIRDALRSQPRG